jgi:CPA2 family monovalent cation:H+ antiporter-2
MDLWGVLAKIILLLSAAFLLGYAARRLRQSPIVGYLLAGTVLGAALFSREELTAWGELGVALLLFSVGLEFSFTRLKRMGPATLGIGVLQVAVTLALFALVFGIGRPAGAALAWGEIVAVSSTAIVLRVLADRAELDSISGRTSLGILLVQDLAVVPLVLVIAVAGRGGSAAGVTLEIGRAAAAAGGLILLFYGLFYHLIPRMIAGRGGLFVERELMGLLGIIIAVGSAWAAHALGLSPALGAFLAGMLLAESPFAVQIRSDIGALRTLFVTLFFTSVGMLADPGWLLENWAEVLFWLGQVFCGKALVIFGIGLLFRLPPVPALATGIGLAQIGEFSFVLAAEARAGGLLDAHSFSLAVSVAILSMFLAPYMAAFARPAARGILARLLPRAAAPAGQEPPKGASERVFIVGFGPAGRKVARALLAQGVTPRVIELNPPSVRAAQRLGLAVHVGDATQPEIVAHAGIRGACVVVVTVPDPRSAGRILQNVLALSPASGVIVRSRYHIATRELWEKGAAFAVDEENVVGRELARQVLAFLAEVEPPAGGGRRPRRGDEPESAGGGGA